MSSPTPGEWSRLPLPVPAEADQLGRLGCPDAFSDAEQPVDFVVADRRTTDWTAMLYAGSDYDLMVVVSDVPRNGLRCEAALGGSTFVEGVEVSLTGVTRIGPGRVASGVVEEGIDAVRIGIRGGTVVWASIGRGHFLVAWPVDADPEWIEGLAGGTVVIRDEDLHGLDP
jgi:hypothetical protein